MFKDVASGVAKNMSIMLFQQIATWISTFILMMFLPRMLGPSIYGQLFVAISLVEMFRVIVAYGSSLYLAKTTSRHPEQTGRYIMDGFVVRGAIALASILALFVIARILQYSPEQTYLIMIIGLGLVWHAGTVTLSGCFQGHELVKYISVGYVLEKIFVSAFTIVALLMGANVTVVAVVFFLSTIVSFVSMLVPIRKIAPSLPRPTWPSIVQHAKDGVPYFLFTAFGVIYYKIGSVILSKLAPEEVVGWYGGASRLYDTFAFFPALFSVVVYPVLSKFWKAENDLHSRTTKTGLELMVVVGVLFSICTIVFARPLVKLLYGLEQFEPSIVVLQVLSACLPLLYFDMMMGTLLLSADKQKEQSLLALGAIPLNCVLNLLAIPLFQERFGNGGLGAAVATILTEIVIMSVMLRLVPRGVLTGLRVGLVVRSVISGVVTWIVVFGANSAGVPVLVQLPLAPLAYFGALLALRTFDGEDRQLALEIARSLTARIFPKKRSVPL